MCVLRERESERERETEKEMESVCRERWKMCAVRGKECVLK